MPLVALILQKLQILISIIPSRITLHVNNPRHSLLWHMGLLVLSHFYLSYQIVLLRCSIVIHSFMPALKLWMGHLCVVHTLRKKGTSVHYPLSSFTKICLIATVVYLDWNKIKEMLIPLSSQLDTLK